MKRVEVLLRAVLLVAVLIPCAGVVAAQEPDADAQAAAEDQRRAEGRWPFFDLDPDASGDRHTIDRGPGFYLNTGKLIAVFLLILAWIKLADWVNRDVQRYKLDWAAWNPAVIIPFVLAFLLMLKIPVFAIGLTIMVLALGAPVGAYIYTRNQEVDPSEQVLTPEHLRYLLSRRAKRVGVKISAEKQAEYERGAPVEFKATAGSTDVENNALLLKARQSPGFVLAKDLLADALGHRGDVVIMDYTQESVAVRYQVDGVLYPAASRDRQSGDVLLAAVKTLAGMNPAERGRKQSGRFSARLSGTEYDCRMVCQGTQSGERAIIRLENGSARFHSLADIGMRDKLRQALLEHMNASSGLILFSSLPGNGLSTLLKVATEENDRLLRQFAVIEEKNRSEFSQVDNVDVVSYDAAAGETPASVVPKLRRLAADVLVLPELTDAETVLQVCDFVRDDKLVLAGIHAKDAPEALLRVLMLKVPPSEFAPLVTAVVNVRLIRVLNPETRVAFPPSPDVLKKLGIPQGRIQTLYREPNAEELAATGRNQNSAMIGFQGRTGLFELLIVDKKVRQVLQQQPKLEVVRKAARQAGLRSLQEEGILLVAQGKTSISELSRVLKQ